MYYVYRIQSLKFKDQSYTGFSSNLKERLAKHNAGGNKSTAPFRPWKLVFYAAFEDKQSALNFEMYLKTGSGKAFANKRLW
jgi:putative endonuclease